MAISSLPTVEQLLHPILEMATKEAITRRSAHEAMVKKYGLSKEQQTEALASGGSRFLNRVGWAMTFLTKPGLIERIAVRTYRATNKGCEFLKTHPKTITDEDIRSVPGWHEAWEAGRSRRRERVQASAAPESVLGETSTPDEMIERAVSAKQADLRGRLLQSILNQTPEFFERLVIDVLLKLGYGGSRADAAEHLGQSGDEGIDGRINQDPLGLDQIMVQAKRFAPDAVVGRKEIQAFVGSLAGQGVSKGIFITTSSFAGTAEEYVQRGATTKVVLVDGEMLIDLMVQHGIGVRVEQRFELHELDQNYFTEEE